MSAELTLRPVATGLDFPTSVALDGQGGVVVAESGLPFGGAKPGGRVWHVDRSGVRELLAEGLRAPVNGAAVHDRAVYLSEGGHPPRISRLDPDGSITTILEGLPGPGNYHLNMVAVGPEGKLYFSQGAMTNMGVVGLDAYELGWLGRLPHAHDVPGYDIVLAETNVETPDPLSDSGQGRATTGAFAPFGHASEPGGRIRGEVPATAAVMRCHLDGSDVELVAWGLRNAYGLCFLPDGRLLATDQGPDDRGSRPVGNAPDLLFEVRPGAWYGWPDFIGGDPVTEASYTPTRGPAPGFVLANHHDLPPPEPALVRFPPHAAAVKLDVAPAGTPWPGHLVVALFGDEAPMTAPPGPPVGRGLVRVDPSDWSMHPLAQAPLRRPIDVAFDTDGSLWVLDFGEFEMSEQGVQAEAGTGVLWRAEIQTAEAR